MTKYEVTSEILGRNQYAAHQQVSPAAVTKAIRSGRITAAVIFGKGGRVEGIRWRQADELWRRNTDVGEAAKSRKTAGPELQTSAPAAAAPARDPQVIDLPPELRDEAPTGNAHSLASYLVSRARKQDTEARHAELDYMKAVGLLVPAEDVKREIFKSVRALRDSLLNIPDRMAPLLAAELDATRLHAVLTSEIKQVLQTLSDKFADASNDEPVER